MPVLSITTDVTGVVDVVPRLIYIKTTDSFTTVQAAGYLNHSASAFGFIFTKNDFVAIYSTVSGMAWAQVTINTSGLIVLVFVTENPTDQVWQNVTAASVQLRNNTGYTCNAGASLIAFTLPLLANIGDWIEIVGFSSGGWKIAQNANQSIRFNGLASTTGVVGYVASLTQYDCIKLRCSTANLVWSVVTSEGSITVF